MSDGFIVDNLEAARIMLADSPTWQGLKSSWTDRTSAMAGVHLIGADLPAAGFADLRPFALVQMPPESLRMQISGSGPDMAYTTRGAVEIEIQIDAVKQNQAEDPALQFYRTLSGLMLDLAERSNQVIGNVGMIRLSEIAIVGGPARTAQDDVETMGDAFMATLRLGWGLR